MLTTGCLICIVQTVGVTVTFKALRDTVSTGALEVTRVTSPQLCNTSRKKKRKQKTSYILQYAIYNVRLGIRFSVVLLNITKCVCFFVTTTQPTESPSPQSLSSELSSQSLSWSQTQRSGMQRRLSQRYSLSVHVRGTEGKCDKQCIIWFIYLFIIQHFCAQT